MSNELYDMKLNDELAMDKYCDVLRVPGGWIYKQVTECGSGGYTCSMCFVPFDNEFQASPPDTGEN